MKNCMIFILFSFLLSACTNSPEDQRPNILFVMMDDLGFGQFGVYNDTLKVDDFDPFFVQLVDSLQGYSKEKALEFSKLAIPTMTNLAKNGILFTKAYASSNLCAPSRIGIATGILQNRFGVYENADGEAHGIPPGSHLVKHLKTIGYQTAHIGKWHIGRRNKKILSDILKKHGLPENTNYFDLSQSHPEIFNEIKQSGYYGSVIEEHHPLNNGFDYYYGYNTWASEYYHSTYVWENFQHAGQQKGYNTDVFTEKAMDFMTAQLANKEPFFLQLHYHAVHDSIEPKAPDQYYNRFQSPSFDLNNFYAHIYGVDYNIKRMVDLLKSKNAFDNTIIVFTSDNGAMAGGRYDGNKIGSPLPGNAPFSGHKGNFYQGGIRVPLFVHWPNGIEASSSSGHMVSTMDILPTLIDAARGEVPTGIDGKSLLPLFNDPNHPSIHSHLLWAGMHSNAWGFLVEKSTKDHHTERPYAPAAWVVCQGDYLLRFTGNISPGIYYEQMDGGDPSFQLYHIGDDPAETYNLKDEIPEKVQEMKNLFFEEFVQWPPPTTWDRQKWEELAASKLKL